MQLVEELAAPLARFALRAFEEALRFPIDGHELAFWPNALAAARTGPRLHFREWLTTLTIELPLFELPVVLLPGELMPLHIFEERYKRMIGHCLETEEPFGIVLRDDDGSARRIGCTARVTEVLERFDDGRMDIVVTGEEPFRVLERFDGTGVSGRRGRGGATSTTRSPAIPTPPKTPARRSPTWCAGCRAPSPRSRASTRATPTRSPLASSCRC